MSKLKVGDRVKIAESSKYYDANAKPYSNNPLCEGVLIQIGEGDTDYWVTWDNGRHNAYNKEDLILVTTQETMPTKQLTLEEVYVEAPTKMERDILRFYGEQKKVRVDNIVGDASIFWFEEDLGKKGKPGFNGTYAYYAGGRTKVSIPIFLQLLEDYAPVKQDVVIKLTNDLTATLQPADKIVSITGPADYDVSFTTVLELETALSAKPSHTLQNGDFVNPGDGRITKVLLEMAGEAGIGGNQAKDYMRYPVLLYLKGPDKITTVDLTGDFLGLTKELTVKEFIDKLGAKQTPLPSIAGYQVKRSTDYVGAIKIGCQTIKADSLTSLFKAIHDAQDSN